MRRKRSVNFFFSNSAASHKIAVPPGLQPNHFIPMLTLRYNQPGFAKALKPLDRVSSPGDEVQATVAQIIRDVRDNGDAALLDYTAKFGGPKLKASQLQVTKQEIDAANKCIKAKTREAVLAAHENVRSFAKNSLRKSWKAK